MTGLKVIFMVFLIAALAQEAGAQSYVLKPSQRKAQKQKLSYGQQLWGFFSGFAYGGKKPQNKINRSSYQPLTPAQLASRFSTNNSPPTTIAKGSRKAKKLITKKPPLFEKLISKFKEVLGISPNKEAVNKASLSKTEKATSKAVPRVILKKPSLKLPQKEKERAPNTQAKQIKKASLWKRLVTKVKKTLGIAPKTLRQSDNKETAIIKKTWDEEEIDNRGQEEFVVPDKEYVPLKFRSKKKKVLSRSGRKYYPGRLPARKSKLRKPKSRSVIDKLDEEDVDMKEAEKFVETYEPL